EAARAAGLRVIGLLGRDGGALRALCDIAIVVPSTTTARIQEAHIFMGHTLCAMVEAALGLA
ncbi:MAG: phosphoheptose isomerase, partial [Steroidobacteraceae bacterium]